MSIGGVKLITISSIRVEDVGERSRLVGTVKLDEYSVDNWKKNIASIENRVSKWYRESYLDNNSFDMWFDVPSEYKYALCAERSDAFVVALLYFAMVAGEDIKTDIPITEQLLYQLKEYVIPALCRKDDGFDTVIHIIADTAHECPKNDNFVGTGISCGVDSFSTVLQHINDDIPDDFMLTHLTLFNTGSMNFTGYGKVSSLEEWRSDTVKEFDTRIEIGKNVANELGLKFIDIDTNIPDLYQGLFYCSHLYRNCSAVLATQKMWRYYYYASAGEGIKSNVTLRTSPAEYDTLVLPLISISNLDFYSGGLVLERLEKTSLMADNKIVQKYINVCAYETDNCGKCSKCIRTMLALDLLGKLDNFKESFKDMSFYRANKWKYMALIYEADEKDTYMYELKKYIRKSNIKYSTKTKLYHFLLPLRKLKSIIRRG